MLYDTSIPLPLAAWLVHDEYDYGTESNYVSATQLLQPTRSIVLAQRLPQQEEIDLDALMAPRMGSAIHDSIEQVWKNKSIWASSLKRLGYPEKIINSMDIHIEERSRKPLNGFVVGGKFDMVLSGTLFDFKSTSVYSWINGDKDKDYQLQGSIYRWLNPELILEDFIVICFIFTNWSQKEAAFKQDYPKRRIMSKAIPLLSMQQTENWIRTKLNEVKANLTLNQDEMIRCTDEELWRNPPVFKYYASGDTTKRATRCFDTAGEAAAYKTKNKNKGSIVFVPGEPKRCNYCAAAPICMQRHEMFGGESA